METIRTDIVERLYSGDPDAKPFLDPEPPVEVQMPLKQSQAAWCFISATAERRDSCSVDRI